MAWDNSGAHDYIVVSRILFIIIIAMWFWYFFLRYTYHNMAMVKISQFYHVFYYFIWIKLIFKGILKMICRGGLYPHLPLKISFLGRVGGRPAPKNWFVGAGGGQPAPTNLFHNFFKNSFNSNTTAKHFKEHEIFTISILWPVELVNNIKNIIQHV